MTPTHCHSQFSQIFVLRSRGFSILGWLLWQLVAMAMSTARSLVQRGGSSRASSPGSTPRNAMVGSFSLASVPIDWDNNPAIRERIRCNHNLCLAFNHEKQCEESNYVDSTVANVKLNSMVLEPIVMIMKDNDLQLPSIDSLIKSVNDFFELAKLSRSSDHCYQEAWSIRRLIGKLKRFTYRNQPPQDCVVSIWCLCYLH